MAEKTYEKVTGFIKENIISGVYGPGSKLPTERELALRLGISRNSVREGLRVMENIGVITSHHGSGNYISLNFDDMMSEMLSFMYFLKSINEQQIIEFRWMIEESALKLANKYITKEEKEILSRALANLEKAASEEERTKYDRIIHQTIVNASRNDFLIANYRAFTSFIESHIKMMRSHIIHGMQTARQLELTHRHIVQGLLQNDLRLSMAGLREHFDYIDLYRK